MIRLARKEDAPEILAMIQELADFERESDAPALSVSDLIRDGFSDQALFHVLLAEEHDRIKGMAFIYERYSTWKGKSLYLEDLIVKKEFRGQGIGSRLMDAVIDKAREGGYTRLEWQVLDWNEGAIEFYKKLGVELDSSWINCRMTME